MTEEERERLMFLLEQGKPKFPWGTVGPCLIGAAIGAALIIWGMMM